MNSLKNRAGMIALVVVAGVSWACDIPTDTPKLEQEWIVPITETSIEVAELLPTDVELTEDSSAFTIQVDPIAFEENLGVLCPACAGLDGLTVPKPAFEDSFHESLPLPDRVESAQVREGRVVVAAWNGLGFDPLRPPGGETGSFTIALRDGGPDGTILDEVEIDGAVTSFGPGDTLERELEYSGLVTDTISVTVHVVSPAGGPEPGNWVPIALANEIEATATPEVLEAESAEIDVSNEVFDVEVTELDVEDVSEDMVDKIQSGSLIFEIVNPWSVGAVLNLTITGPTMGDPVVLIASVPATPVSTVEVELTQAELQAFLGEPNVVLIGQGTVDPNAGTVTLAPGQTLIIDSKLDLVILIG